MQPKEGGGEGDEDDDYMTMTFDEPDRRKTETSMQRLARVKREREARSRPLPKAEREGLERAEEAARREEGLETALDKSNKGFRMLEKLGFKGGALGKGGDESEAITKPIAVKLRDGRTGIGMEEQQKRKLREEAEREPKRPKLDENEYRERVSREREAERLQGELVRAQKAARDLDEPREDTPGAGGRPAPSKPLKGIDVSWRGLAKRRLIKERDRHQRRAFYNSLGGDAEENEGDSKLEFGREEADEDLDEDDPDLDAFEALEPSEKLAKVVSYLRSQHHHCYWCKMTYPDAAMDGCPGETEEMHD